MNELAEIERERKKERERERDRQTDRQTERVCVCERKKKGTKKN